MILGLIPARAGSKRVHMKNMRMFCGKPLVGWTIEAALASGMLDDVVVSSDSDEILAYAGLLACRAERRPDWLSTDDASVYDLVRWFLKSERPEAIVLLQPTSPLRIADDIDDQLRCYLDGASMSVSEGSVEGNGAIYAAPAWRWRHRCFNFDNSPGVSFFSMPASRSIDVNTEDDFARAEAMMRERA